MTENEIRNALNRLESKLSTLEIENLAISDYNKSYLKQYQSNFNFYSGYYFQLLSKLLQNTEFQYDKTFIDYGGGCGILSYLACELGIQQVIYNDLFAQSVKDAQVISKYLNYSISNFVEGDIQDLILFLNKNNIQPDYICSFDVLEHIYNLKDWFTKLRELKGDWKLVFITSANAANPIINRKLKKLHHITEYQGFEKSKAWKEIDTADSYLEVRKKIISENFSQFNQKELIQLAHATRGLRIDDILKQIEIYIETGKFHYKNPHSTNTCDPFTGNWNEHLIDLNRLSKVITQNGFKFQLHHTQWSMSHHRVINFFKGLLNKIIQFLPSHFSQLSPMYMIEVQNIRDI
ncbi:MAG: class I SAM-dependent methyltransferase [Flavobacteriaceae bacterium]|nr:class I SAM-dependent methyltransferase [Flavobacteriaceae bacterium]